jgi:dipeptidyl aminopeptidase/acylaminoacyl peptidase
MNITSDKQLKPFGLWPSPISASILSQSFRLEDVQWDSDGHTLVWLEGRSGIGVLVSQPEGEARRDLTVEHNVRGGVGYGGGEFSVAQGVVLFADKGGRLYRRAIAAGQPHPITPAFGKAASPVLSPNGHWVLFVHTDEGRDVLALVDAEGDQWPVKLVTGSDFYMQPVWHPDGERLAWIEWDHPNMPWDGTRLKYARLLPGSKQVEGVELVAGGFETPVFQPAFSPNGRWLSYIAEEGEWDHLCLVDLSSGKRTILVEGGTLSQPAWVQGMRVYGWSPSSQHLYYLRCMECFASLWKVDSLTGESTPISLGEYAWMRQLSVSPVDERLAFLATGTQIPERVVTWDGQQLQVQGYSDPEMIAPEDLPQPRLISWSPQDNPGMQVYGVFYPPSSSRYRGDGLPPAIINIHGGPTGTRPVTYNAEAAYFTSRGYAWFELNYRGSTGFGRTYRQSLNQHWGELDVEDAIGGAQALVDQGLVDPQRLVIKGGSAGGYTVLNTLIRYPGRFKAGLCSFGVSNLFTLAMETHKFEAHYLDKLVGTLPEASARYHFWSPVFHAGQIKDPIAIFQGSEDVVVPPEQSDAIVKILQARGVPHHYRLFKGEGHGFRKSENIATYLQDIERFLQQHVIFSA